jgi:hypothetical protein
MVSKLGFHHDSKISFRGNLFYCLSGIRRIVGTSLIRALIAERRNSSRDAKRKPYKCSPRRGKVSMPVKGADHPVVVMKFL